MSINRRTILGGAGLAGAAAATGVGVERLVSESRSDKDAASPDDPARFGDPRIPAELLTSQTHLFRLGASPVTTLDGGSFRQADEESFPIMTGQAASFLVLTLQPGAIREPHWHPSAWEINIVTQGVAGWTLIDGNGNHESFEQHVGDVVFAPQGSFHYFENRGSDDLKIVIVQNTSAAEPNDNIGIGESLSRLPPRVLSALFGVPADTFGSFKKIDKGVVVLRKSR